MLQDRLRNKFEPDIYYNKAMTLLDNVDKERFEEWYKNPCTQSLIYSLEGDMTGIIMQWTAGNYAVTGSIEASSQRESKALGMAQAIDDVLTHISDMKENVTRGEDPSDGTPH